MSAYQTFEAAEGERPVSAPMEVDYVQTAVSRLAAGIRAALIIRLIAGETDQTYTPDEVSTMVSEVIDQQVARLRS